MQVPKARSQAAFSPPPRLSGNSNSTSPQATAKARMASIIWAAFAQPSHPANSPKGFPGIASTALASQLVPPSSASSSAAGTLTAIVFPGWVRFTSSKATSTLLPPRPSAMISANSAVRPSLRRLPAEEMPSGKAVSNTGITSRKSSRRNSSPHGSIHDCKNGPAPGCQTLRPRPVPTPATRPASTHHGDRALGVSLGSESGNQQLPLVNQLLG